MNSASGAFGQRSACADQKSLLASAKADARRVSAFEGRFQSARKPPATSRPARRMNSASGGLRSTVGLRRPKSTSRIGEGRRPARQRLRRPISIGTKASGHQSACAPNEFGLRWPSADGRPAPTKKHLLASAKADARRTAPWKADFNRHRAFGNGGLHAE
jgi:hypothetical protein